MVVQLGNYQVHRAGKTGVHRANSVAVGVGGFAGVLI